MAYVMIKKFPVLRLALLGLARSRVKEKIRSIEPYLKSKATIVDIGAGNGVIAETLDRRGYKVSALDVGDSSLVSTVVPDIYDGRKIPYNDKHFDIALLITVLHHISEPVTVLKEAMRVAQRVIIIEEVYNNKWEKYLTYWIDSLFNLEFFNHPHSNKTDAEWKSIFRDLGYKLVTDDQTKSFAVLRRSLYVLEQ